MNKKTENYVEKKDAKKTWVNLTPEEISKLSVKTACMYGKKTHVN